MLRELSIQHLAVIDHARLQLEPGLVVFTGATGAGKSLLIGSLEALLGLRPMAKLAAGDGGASSVDAVFELTRPAQAAALSALLDQPLEVGGELVVSRGGGGRVRINGRPVAAATLKQAAEWLVDIEGQRDSQRLLRPAAQREALDAWAGLDAAACAAVFAAWRRLEARATGLAEGARLRGEKLELMGFQAAEIDAVAPQAGEWQRLQGQERRLGAVERLRGESEAVGRLLEEEGGLDALRRGERLLGGLAELDPALAPVQAQLREALIAAEEAARDLGRYAGRLEGDPEALHETRTRLDALQRLARKYAKNSPEVADEVEAVCAYRARLGADMAALERERQDEAGLAGERARLSALLAAEAAKLTRARKAAAAELAPLLQRAVRELGLSEARLRLAVAALPAPGPEGADEVVIEACLNPGQPWKALAEAASGGELARVLLALKATLAEKAASGAVLVFDEIDAHVGARLGTVMGRQLAKLAAGGQVLCITHTAQVAAAAGQHLLIRKEVVGRGAERSTRTRIEPLAGEARVAEVAEMLGGAAHGPAAVAQAREMLAA